MRHAVTDLGTMIIAPVMITSARTTWPSGAAWLSVWLGKPSIAATGPATTLSRVTFPAFCVRFGSIRLTLASVARDRR